MEEAPPEAKQETTDTIDVLIQALRNAFAQLEDDEFDFEVDLERTRRYSERKLPAKKAPGHHQEQQQLRSKSNSNKNNMKPAPVPMANMAAAAALPMRNVATAAAAKAARTEKDSTRSTMFAATQDTRKRPPPPPVQPQDIDDNVVVVKKPKNTTTDSNTRHCTTTTTTTAPSSLFVVARATDCHLRERVNITANNNTNVPTNNKNNSSSNSSSSSSIDNHGTLDAPTPQETVVAPNAVTSSSFSYPIFDPSRLSLRQQARRQKRLQGFRQQQQAEALIKSRKTAMVAPAPVRSSNSAGAEPDAVTSTGVVSAAGGDKYQSSRITDFDTRCKQLEQYKAIHGDMQVPYNYPGFNNLGRWTRYMKHTYHNNRTNFPRVRIAKLNELNFDWGTPTSKTTRSGGGGRSGGTRKSDKRGMCPKPDRPNSSSNIPRPDRPTSSRSTRRTAPYTNGAPISFEMRLAHLKRFKALHGHTRVPCKYTGFHNLGMYVGRIKHKYHNLKTMPLDQKAKLDEIDFDWTLRVVRG